MTYWTERRTQTNSVCLQLLTLVRPLSHATLRAPNDYLHWLGVTTRYYCHFKMSPSLTSAEGQTVEVTTSGCGQIV